jgi:hypothetical protein
MRPDVTMWQTNAVTFGRIIIGRRTRRRILLIGLRPISR